MSQQTQGKNVMVQGRIVWVAGDLFKGDKKTDQQTKQVKLDQNGQPIMQYGFGLAVPKSVFSQTGPGQPGEIWAAIQGEVMALYPSGQIPPAFAYKYKDGDGVDHNGAPFNQREGYAGCLIFALTTQIPIKFFRFEGGQNIMVNEGIKCGDYVNVQVSVKAHGAIGTSKPGMYLNPNAVQLVAPGKEIINSPSGDQIFGVQAPPTPQNYVAPEMGAMPQMGQAPAAMPQMGQPPAMPQGNFAPQGFTAPPQQMAPPATPHYGVLPQAHQPSMQQSPAPTAPFGQPGMPMAPGQPMAAPTAQFAPPTQSFPNPGQGFPAQPQQFAPPSAPQGMPAAPAMPGAPAPGGFPNPFGR